MRRIARLIALVRTLVGPPPQGERDPLPTPLPPVSKEPWTIKTPGKGP